MPSKAQMVEPPNHFDESLFSAIVGNNFVNVEINGMEKMFELDVVHRY